MARARKIEDVLREAAAAVAAAEVPDDLRSAAFQEAVKMLTAADAGNGDAANARSETRRKSAAKESGASKAPPDEASFFSQLADESGVGEEALRDVLQVMKDRKVHVTPATRKLGESKAEQAKTVIALVASARAHGLGEDPVDAEAVRQEAKRKRCFDKNNFAGKALTPLNGFNAGSNRNEIKLTSKWVGEFKTAVNRARGLEATEGDGS
jgi:hypothetical protein